MSLPVLIIDDDEKLSSMVASYLGGRGVTVECRADAATGLAALREKEYAALILDVMLPDADGFDVCRELRAESDIPILMLTGRGDEMDRIVGLELGADDYLPKPFNPRELLARLKAIQRRRGSERPRTTASVLDFGPLQIDSGRMEVRLRGALRELTSHQFALLLVLAQRLGRVQTRDQLMEAVRGEQLQSFDRSIDVHISRIRAAIEDDPAHPIRIKTVRAAGYVFLASADDS
ncbi:MAG: response regulator transcription factor [Polyangiaceae bacterium]|nr:response regulator transcription factor [Polyangiaceae bacterium]